MAYNVTDQFDARAEDGTIYRVIERRRRIDTSNLVGQSSMPGLPEFRLADGRAVKRINDMTFEILRIGQRLTRLR